MELQVTGMAAGVYQLHCGDIEAQIAERGPTTVTIDVSAAPGRGKRYLDPQVGFGTAGQPEQREPDQKQAYTICGSDGIYQVRASLTSACSPSGSSSSGTNL